MITGAMTRRVMIAPVTVTITSIHEKTSCMVYCVVRVLVYVVGSLTGILYELAVPCWLQWFFTDFPWGFRGGSTDFSLMFRGGSEEVPRRFHKGSALPRCDRQTGPKSPCWFRGGSIKVLLCLVVTAKHSSYASHVDIHCDKTLNPKP